MAESWAGAYGDRLELVQGTFSRLDDYADAIWMGWCWIWA